MCDGYMDECGFQARPGAEMGVKYSVNRVIANWTCENLRFQRGKRRMGDLDVLRARQ